MVKYIFNETVFQNIDTAEKAYWLGFLYADGCVHQQKIEWVNKKGEFRNCFTYSLSLSLNQKDEQILINFLNFLEIKNNYRECLFYEDKTNSVRITIGRKNFCLDLIDKRIIPNKTYNNSTKIWESIPEAFKRDFVLGFWDGDGSVSCYYNEKEKKYIQNFSIISLNSSLLSLIVEYINKALHIENFCKVTNYGYPRIRINYSDAKIFGDFLYENINYSVMQRKYENYLKMELRKGNKAHFGFQNIKTKGVFCVTSGKYYSTVKEASIGEFNEFTRTSISSIQRACKKGYNYKNKQFRYCTDEEKEKMKNGKSNLQMVEK